MEIITIIALVIYLVIYLPIIIANRRIRQGAVLNNDSKSVACTLVIPFHNESENLLILLLSLEDLVGKPEQIILVDDFSTDGSFEIAQDICQNKTEIVLFKNEYERGKKGALKSGILKATHPTIVTTDADCRFTPNWINQLYGSHMQQGNKLTIGLVDYLNTGNWLSYYQWMESRALMSVGVGMFKLGYPIMCNGANLIFEKETWLAVNGYDNHQKIKSGDDIFLMHDIWIQGKSDVGLCLSPEAVVYTNTTKGFRAFMKQRKRWAGKTGKYQLPIANLFPFIIVLANLCIIYAFVSLISNGEIANAVGFLLVKTAIDYFTIISLKQGFASCVSFVMVMQFQLFQLIYPFLLPFFKSDWKR